MTHKPFALHAINAPLSPFAAAVVLFCVRALYTAAEPSRTYDVPNPFPILLMVVFTQREWILSPNDDPSSYATLTA